MSGKLVTGLAAGAGALAGLVTGGAVGMQLGKGASTPDTRTATIALGSAVGMFVGAASLAALVAEPEPSQTASTGTAGIPKGVGSARSRTANMESVVATVHPHPWDAWFVAGAPPGVGRPARRGGAINSQLSPRR
jgi:hypothetical protein